MNVMAWLLTGGFFKGYRTYVMAGVGVIAAVAAYAVGDADLTHTITAVAGALSMAGLRAAIPPAA